MNDNDRSVGTKSTNNHNNNITLNKTTISNLKSHILTEYIWLFSVYVIISDVDI